MIRRCSAVLLGFVIAASAGSAAAEDSPFGEPEKPLESFEVEGFEIAPFLDVRVRGEYRTFPPNDGIYGERAVLEVGAVTTSLDSVDDQILVWERARLGLQVARGPLLARVSFQDVRAAGTPTRGAKLVGQPELPVTAPHEAYAELATDTRDLYLRLGRQEVVLGDGRLVGRSDDAPVGRALDAVRVGGSVGDFDLQALAVMLALPGEKQGSSDFGAGAQLYALDGVWNVAPYLRFELLGLARLVREPLVDVLTPSDVGLASIRVFGEHLGVRYSLLGAFEAGRVAVRDQNDNASLVAGAVAGRVAWETALPWRVTFGAQGAYASGGPETGEVPDLQTFDPILPDSTAHFGQGGHYALTNLIEAGGDVALHPLDELVFSLGYRFAGLADPNGKWVTAALFPVGASGANTSHVLGHVGAFDFRATPWQQLSLGASFSILVFGDGAKAIYEETHLARAGEAPDFSEMTMLDARLMLP